MKKETNKIAEKFDIASLEDSFWEEIRKFRKKFDIPENGFYKVKEVHDYLEEKEKLIYDSEYELRYGPPYFIKKDKSRNSRPKELKRYLDAQEKILSKFRIPFSGREILMNYIVGNNDIKFYPEGTDDFSWYLPSEEELENFGKPFVKFVIHDSASLSNFKDYLDREWKYIKEGLEAFGVDFKRIRIREDKDIKDFVIREFRRTRKELGLKPGV